MIDTNEMIRQRVAALRQEEAAVLFAVLASTGEGSDRFEGDDEAVPRAGPPPAMK